MKNNTEMEMEIIQKWNLWKVEALFELTFFGRSQYPSFKGIMTLVTRVTGYN